VELQVFFFGKRNLPQIFHAPDFVHAYGVLPEHAPVKRRVEVQVLQRYPQLFLLKADYFFLRLVLYFGYSHITHGL
jgi:hypothetical protein